MGSSIVDMSRWVVAVSIVLIFTNVRHKEFITSSSVQKGIMFVDIKSVHSSNKFGALCIGFEPLRDGCNY